jgi:hypothetical protein
MSTGLLTDVIQVGSNHAESVISEWNLKCASGAPTETVKVMWHAHCLQIFMLLKNCFKGARNFYGGTYDVWNLPLS